MIQNDTDPICDKCRYNLLGLQAIGTCPECGNPYDRGSGLGIQSSANARLQKNERILRRFKIAFYFSISAITMMIGGILAVFSDSPGKPLIIAGLCACVLAMPAILALLPVKR